MSYFQTQNERLRRHLLDDLGLSASGEATLDELLNLCTEGDCERCSEIICPHQNVMHFHHDGCPECCIYQDEAP